MDMKWTEPLIEQGCEIILKEGVKASPNNIDQAVFDAKVLPNAVNKVLIKKSLLEDVGYIKETIDLQREKGSIVELAFLMLGYGREDGTVIIDKIEIDEEKFLQSVASGKEQSASFAGKLTTSLNNYARECNHEKPVIIHGHTHPNGEKKGIQDTYTNGFSFFDVSSAFDLANSIKTFNSQNNKNVHVATMVVNSSGDFNIICCDTKSQNDFYKFPDVELEGIGKLPAFKGKCISDILAQKNDEMSLS